MKLKLHTLSPLHIGSGNSLEPFEYIIDNGTYYRINQNKAFELALKAHPYFPTRFDSWLARTSQAIRKEKDNAKQAKLRANFNFKYFCENILGDYELAQKILNEAYAYKCEVPFPLSVKRQISELYKQANGKLIIPGTSIKGAIRTILAWNAFLSLNSGERKFLLNKTLNSNAFKKVQGRRLDDLIMEELFVCGKRTFNGKIDFSDIKLDILKFIKISDARAIDAKMAVYPSNLYLMDKTPQTQAPALETIDFNSSFEFEITINEPELRIALNKATKQNPDVWIDLPKKFKNIFGFSISEVDEGVLEEKIIDAIRLAIADFSETSIKREKKWLDSFEEIVIERKKRAKNANIESIEEFYEAYTELPYIFRIGWASGFHNTTIFEALLATDKGFVKELFKKFKIGVPPQRKKDPNISLPNLDNFPKSRRLTAETKNTPVDPFGWVALLEEDQNLELE